MWVVQSAPMFNVPRLPYDIALHYRKTNLNYIEISHIQGSADLLMGIVFYWFQRLKNCWLEASNYTLHFHSTISSLIRHQSSTAGPIPNPLVLMTLS